jgi:hypothetical protein
MILQVPRFLLQNFCLLSVIAGVAAADSPANLKPMMAVPDAVVLKDDFSRSHALQKGVWQTRQGTRWSIEDGVLRGQQSSPEFQAKKKDHFGYEPRLSIPVTPPEFIASFSFQFLAGSETAVVPYIEFGHHVCRVRFSQQGATLLVDHETLKLTEATDFLWQSDKWYHALAEMKDGHFVMQIDGGPTLFAQHDSFATQPTSGGNGFGVAGPKKGFVELDNLTIWNVKEENQPGWSKRMSKFPHYTPVRIKEPKNR